MTITPHLFSSFLKCPTKCWLLATSEPPSGNAFADWTRSKNEIYRTAAVEKLRANTSEGQISHAPDAANLKTATWRLAVDLKVETGTMESQLHAVERVPSEGRGKPRQLIPVRFTFFNKLTKDDRLLVAFDALLLFETLGREVTMGKIVHGDDHATLKVKVTSLLAPVRKLTGKMCALLAAGSAPDLILNRHCGECEFRDGCRQRRWKRMISVCFVA
jgi:predicted RecB family nuclease